MPVCVILSDMEADFGQGNALEVEGIGTDMMRRLLEQLKEQGY